MLSIKSKQRRFSCPMHSEVEAALSGDCPVCGMALEEKIVSIFKDKSVQSFQSNLLKDQANLRQRLTVCIVFLIPLLSIEPLKLSKELTIAAQFLLTTPIVLWGGWQFFKRAIESLKRLTANMYTLIAMGILVAYGYSSIVWLTTVLLPDSLLRHSVLSLLLDNKGNSRIYFDSAATIVTLSLLGQYLEGAARLATGQAIGSLIALAPKSARLIASDGSEVETSLDNLSPGDLLRVRAGEQIPGDGVIEEGAASINESMLTGEATPVEKMVGDHVRAGTTNGISTFLMRMTTDPDESLLAQIIRSVEKSQKFKLPVQELVDRISATFVPIVICVSLLTFFVWAFIFHQLTAAVNNAVSVLIVACPCALGLATPTAVLVAVGIGARMGILIRDSKAMQILATIDCLAVDKTGTLTEGTPSVFEINASHESNEHEILHLAASLEQASNHPLAKGILKLAQERSIELSSASDVQYTIGRGITGIVINKRITLGNEVFFKETKIIYDELLPNIERLRETNASILLLAANNRALGVFALEDAIKKTSAQALQELSKNRIDILMLTGAGLEEATSVARQLHIHTFFADLLPADKAKIIYDHRKNGHVIAMSGDGINDAPALAAADVGVAMGNGSGIAIDSADIILVKGDLLGISRAIKLSKALVQNVDQNLFLAFAYNILAIPIAAGAFTPHFGISLTPAISSIAMSLSSLSVIANALKLRLQKF